MASLLFTCPATLQEAPTGIETDVQSLQAAWKPGARPVSLPPAPDQGSLPMMKEALLNDIDTGRHRATLKVKCPHCGEVHEISVRELLDQRSN